MPCKLGTLEARFGLITGSHGSSLVSKSFTKDPSSPCPSTRSSVARLEPTFGHFSCYRYQVRKCPGACLEHAWKCGRVRFWAVSSALSLIQ